MVMAVAQEKDQITDAMVLAGIEAFEHWVGSEGDERSVQEMPSIESISKLLRSAFRAMQSARA